MNQQKSLQVNVLWNTTGSIFYLGCQWLVTVLVVRLSGVEDAGTLSLAMSVCNIWYCLAVYGMRNFQVSDTIRKYQPGTYLFSRVLTCGAAFAGCAMYIFIIPYNTFQKICIIAYFVFKMSEIFFDVYAGIYQQNWRLDYGGKSLIMRGILTLASFALIAGYTSDLLLALVGMAVTSLTVIFLYDIPSARSLVSLKLNTDIGKVKDLLRECLPLVVYTLLSTAIASIPRLFMERILGDYQLGIYASVATPTLIIQMGATYVFNPFVTLFAEKYYQKAKDQFLSALRNCVLTVGVIAVVGVAGGHVFGEWGLKFLYGEEVASYYDLLIPLIICTVLTAFSWLLCGVLTAVRGLKGLVIANVAAVAVAAILSPIWENQYGMQGASYTLALATIIEMVILILVLANKIRKQF